jgi:glutathione S-transferase
VSHDRTLISLHVSPWSERVRWAFEHHDLTYRRVEHVPILGEGRLRRIVGPDKPRATVPVLLAGDQVITESWDIAQYADREGKHEKLFPPGRDADVRRWATLADETCQSGRALVLAATLASPAALDANLPPAVPSFLRPLLRPITRAVTKRFVQKYELALGDREAQLRTVRAALEEIRRALAASPYLLGAFSYADIAVATLIQGISPVADRFLRLPPATRQAWTQAQLAADFADLVSWRDRIYEQHRPARARARGL